jgi:hypothetical protein
MRTPTLCTIQQSSYLDTLLDALVLQMGLLPEYAARARHPGAPAVLSALKCDEMPTPSGD